MADALDLSQLEDEVRSELDSKYAAREGVLKQTRPIIRASANAIRALHRGDEELADELLHASDPLLEAIKARQAQELVETARDRERQKRELTRSTQALLVNGLELLASVYVDGAAAQHGAAVRNADIPMEELIAVSPERAVANAERVLDAAVDIRMNLRPGLVLTNLLVDLGRG